MKRLALWLLLLGTLPIANCRLPIRGSGPVAAEKSEIANLKAEITRLRYELDRLRIQHALLQELGRNSSPPF